MANKKTDNTKNVDVKKGMVRTEPAGDSLAKIAAKLEKSYNSAANKKQNIQLPTHVSPRQTPLPILKQEAAKATIKQKTRVLFVCTGNTCRSPMAEQIFKSYLKQKKLCAFFDLKSCGLYAKHFDSMSRQAYYALAQIKISPRQQDSVPFSQKLYDWANYIVCMTEDHMTSVVLRAKEFDLAVKERNKVANEIAKKRGLPLPEKEPKKKKKIYFMAEVTKVADVPDPFGQDMDVYKSTAEFLLLSCDMILKAVTGKING